MSAPKTAHRKPRAPDLKRLGVPLLGGAAVILIGALVGRSQDWSTGALWAVGLAGTLVAAVTFAMLAARRAPRLEARRTSLRLGAAVRPNPRTTDQISPDRVLVLSGHTRSGKSMIAKAVADRWEGWARVSCGEFVRAQARERGIEPRPPATDDLGEQLVRELGGTGFLDAVLESAEVPADARQLVIDDVYHEEVYKAIESRWAHLLFTEVELPASVHRGVIVGPAGGDLHAGGDRVSPLDDAVESLERHHRPQHRIPGAVSADDADRSLGALATLLSG